VSTTRPTPNEELILLVLFHNKEVYGLEIIAAINDSKNMTAGTLYPTLKCLEGKQFINRTRLIRSNMGGGARQYYSITQKGIDAINEMHEMRQRLINWKSPNN
jgi:DNA-binding PadR family transcriptional regulator